MRKITLQCLCCRNTKAVTPSECKIWAFKNYICPECQESFDISKRVSRSWVDSDFIDKVPDGVFIGVLRYRGYTGVLNKAITTVKI
jgi:hypothetical protein